jgi:hypothetical protein
MLLGYSRINIEKDPIADIFKNLAANMFNHALTQKKCAYFCGSELNACKIWLGGCFLLYGRRVLWCYGHVVSLTPPFISPTLVTSYYNE